MKRFLCFFFALCSALHAAPSFVFIHLGPKLPSYLPVALRQTRLFNPDSNIYVIANDEALKNWPRKERDANPICISAESLPRHKAHEAFLQQTKLDKKSYNGLWILSTERFFYLAELMKAYHLADVFHLENDVMLYADAEELLPTLRERYADKIAATFDNDDRAIAGIVYISSYAPIKRLVRFIAQNAHKKWVDMECIAKFCKEYRGQWIDYLPIVSPEYSTDHPLISLNGSRGSDPTAYSLHFDQFQSIFDAAAIGQYLGGIDPVHGASKPGFINERCVFNPSFFSFQWKRDEQGRNVPYALYGGRAFRVNNLHIHSKDLTTFYSGNL